MKNKLFFLIKMSLKKKIATKWFYIANFIFLIAIIGIMNIDNVNLYDEFSKTYTSNSSYIESLSNSEISLYDKDIKTAKKEIEKDNNKILLVIDSDDTNYLKAEVVSYDGVDVLINTVLNNTLSTIRSTMVLEKYNISENMLNELNTAVDITSVRLDDKDSDKTSDTLMGVVFPIIILPIFMLSMFLITMIGAEVNEEKTSKSMEIIISNVSPKVHFFSKVIAGNLFVLVQGLLLILFIIIGTLCRFLISGGVNITASLPTEATDIISSLTSSGIIPNLIYIIPLTLVLMILTFVGYSLLAGILASMTTNQEDYQQLQTPLILISLVGYYLAMMASVFEGSSFIRIVSYIPFISSLLSPVLLVLNQVTVLDMLISIGTMALLLWFLIKYGLRIYKVGILNYSSTGLWKKMFKALKKQR